MLQDVEGKKFGRLTVIQRDGKRDSGHYFVLCRCECGNTCRTGLDAIVSGHTRSCGCYNVEVLKKIKTTHGHSKNYHISSTYRCWRGMLSRCENKNSSTYFKYGARGIKVCDSWHLFENFLEDMGEKPSGLTLGRIDNNGYYCKDNCRWETVEQQMNNKRSSRFITYNNKTLTVAQWERIKGFKRGTLFGRLYLGWDSEKALTTPVRKQ